MDFTKTSNGSASSDDSFPIALDKNLQKISAIDAKKLQKYVADAVFYCPKCYQMNPQKKTKVYPSQHDPPRFNRVKRESHLSTCQYQRNYLRNISRKIGIPLQGKELKLSLLPYERKKQRNLPLREKLNLYVREDHRKWMELIRYLLMDNYEMDFFRKKYSKYRVDLSDGKSKSLTQLVTSIETSSAYKGLNVDKLNVVVGKIADIRINGAYVELQLDDTYTPFSFYLYIDRFFIDADLLSALPKQRICSMGYVHKVKSTDERKVYSMEILSIPHQIAFLETNPAPIQSKIQSASLVTIFEELTQNFQQLPLATFHRLYYEEQLQYLQGENKTELSALIEQAEQAEQQQREIDEKVERLQKRINKNSKKQQEIHQEIQAKEQSIREIENQIIELEEDRNSLQKKNQNWWSRFKRIWNQKTAKLLEEEIESCKQQIQTETERLDQKQRQLLELKKLDETLSAQYQKWKNDLATTQNEKLRLVEEQKQRAQRQKQLEQSFEETSKRAEEEKEWKEQLQLQRDVFESPINEERSILLDLKVQYSDLNMECTIQAFCVKKMDDYVLPDHSHKKGKQSILRKVVSSGQYTNFTEMTKSLEKQIHLMINQLQKNENNQ